MSSVEWSGLGDFRYPRHVKTSNFLYIRFDWFLVIFIVVFL